MTETVWQVPIAAVELADEGRAIVAISADGSCRRIDAALLWAECPSAVGRLRRLDGRYLVVPEGLRVSALREVGNYGVNIAFSDGHDSGIYPWGFLASLGEWRRIDDFLVPDPAQTAQT